MPKKRQNLAANAFEVTTNELTALYKIVHCEARGEGEKGIVLVANVILNRVKTAGFPNSIIEVIEQKNQFEPVRTELYAMAEPTEDVKEAVNKAIAGTDYSQAATYFRTIAGAAGSWHEKNLTKLFDYNNHRFYK